MMSTPQGWAYNKGVEHDNHTAPGNNAKFVREFLKIIDTFY